MEKRIEAMRNMFYNFPENEMRYYVQVSIQRALLGRITCSLRGVTCEWSRSKIKVHFIYDGLIESDFEYLLEEAATHVMADFPVLDVNYQILRIDYPESLDSHALKVWIYRRRE